MEATLTKSIFLPLYWLKSRGAPEISVRGISYKDTVVFWAVAVVHVSSKPKNILENIVFLQRYRCFVMLMLELLVFNKELCCEVYI